MTGITKDAKEKLRLGLTFTLAAGDFVSCRNTVKTVIAELDSLPVLPEPQPGEAEAALETLRDVIFLLTSHDGRSEQEYIHRSHMEAWHTVRAALRAAAAAPDAEAVRWAHEAVAMIRSDACWSLRAESKRPALFEDPILAAILAVLPPLPEKEGGGA